MDILYTTRSKSLISFFSHLYFVSEEVQLSEFLGKGPDPFFLVSIPMSTTMMIFSFQLIMRHKFWTEYPIKYSMSISLCQNHLFILSSMSFGILPLLHSTFFWFWHVVCWVIIDVVSSLSLTNSLNSAPSCNLWPSHGSFVVRLFLNYCDGTLLLM